MIQYEVPGLNADGSPTVHEAPTCELAFVPTSFKSYMWHRDPNQCDQEGSTNSGVVEMNAHVLFSCLVRIFLFSGKSPVIKEILSLTNLKDLSPVRVLSFDNMTVYAPTSLSIILATISIAANASPAPWTVYRRITDIGSLVSAQQHFQKAAIDTGLTSEFKIVNKNESGNCVWCPTFVLEELCAKAEMFLAQLLTGLGSITSVEPREGSNRYCHHCRSKTATEDIEIEFRFRHARPHPVPFQACSNLQCGTFNWHQAVKRKHVSEEPEHSSKKSKLLI